MGDERLKREREFSEEEKSRKYSEDTRHYSTDKKTSNDSMDSRSREYEEEYAQFVKSKKASQMDTTEAWGSQIKQETKIHRKKRKSGDNYRDYDAPEYAKHSMKSDDTSSESEHEARHVFVAKKAKKHKKDKKMKKAIQKELKKEFE